jgi:hypothetical protein
LADHRPFQVAAYHSCDKEVGFKILNGEEDLRISNNSWDWLGEGIYFWEESPMRALEYAEESAKGNQFNKVRIKTPFNKGNNRALDCAVIKYVHQSGRETGKLPYDTIRSAFNEGETIYPGASFTSRLHIQICVLNPDLIRGYFLPRPVELYNPYLNLSA